MIKLPSEITEQGNLVVLSRYNTEVMKKITSNFIMMLLMVNIINNSYAQK